MKTPAPTTAERWAVQRRSLRRGSSAHFLGMKGGLILTFQTRALARAAAKQFRCFGVSATPIRVRVTVEAKGD